MLYGYEHIGIVLNKYFVIGKVLINRFERSRTYALVRVIKHHGVSAQKFLFYLKELEWRFNHQKRVDLFEILAKYLTTLVRLYA
jgi:transposase